MSTTVINIRNAPSGFKKVNGVQFGKYVYIGRPGYFGNPVHISGKYGNFKCCVCGQLHFDAGSTLPCYEKWLQSRLSMPFTGVPSNDVFKLEFAKLLVVEDLVLVCYCKPNPCHGDVLSRYIDSSR